MAFKYAITAEADIMGILRYTSSRFGPQQSEQYAGLIDRAAAMVGDDPMRRGSQRGDDVAPGVRSFHVERAARRRGAAAHVLYYVQATLDDGRDGVIILRVLHERMDPTRHFIEEQ